VLYRLSLGQRTLEKTLWLRLRLLAGMTLAAEATPMLTLLLLQVLLVALLANIGVGV